MADIAAVAAEPVLVQGAHQRAVLLEGQHLLEQQRPLLGQAGHSRNPAVQKQPFLDAVHAVSLCNMRPGNNLKKAGCFLGTLKSRDLSAVSSSPERQLAL